MREYSKNLASNLTKLLVQHKLSIDKLAAAIGIPSMTVRRLVSGQTIDPRISTLRLLATYFNVSMDSLASDTPQNVMVESLASDPLQDITIDSDFSQLSVPVISWDLAEKFVDGLVMSNQIIRKQIVAIHRNDALNVKNLFAVESKPSMYSSYPKGTLFIIAPEVKPVDGDVVLIKSKKNDAIMLKKLQIDPPETYLHSIILNDSMIGYNSKLHDVIGVVILTLLYSHTVVNNSNIWV
jgi:transcriptional regulator with XRE-family HTH domain